MRQPKSWIWPTGSKYSQSYIDLNMRSECSILEDGSSGIPDGDLCSKMLVPKCYLYFSGPHWWTLSELIDTNFHSIFLVFFLNHIRMSRTKRENWFQKKKHFKEKMAPYGKKILSVITDLAADLVCRARGTVTKPSLRAYLGQKYL